MWEQDELGDCGQCTITYLWDAFKSRLEFVVLISTRGGLRPDMLIPTIVVIIISSHPWSPEILNWDWGSWEQQCRHYHSSQYACIGATLDRRQLVKVKFRRVFVVEDAMVVCCIGVCPVPRLRHFIARTDDHERSWLASSSRLVDQSHTMLQKHKELHSSWWWTADEQWRIWWTENGWFEISVDWFD